MRRGWLLAIAIATGLGPLLYGQEQVRYVTENGVTYRETQRVVQEPVTKVEWQEQQTSVLRPRHTTIYRYEPKTVWVPHVEQVYERQWVNWWNPLAPPQYAYRLVPKTRWEMKTEMVRTAQSYWDYVPDTETVKQPVRRLGFQPRTTTERVAVAGPPPVNSDDGRLAREPGTRLPPTNQGRPR